MKKTILTLLGAAAFAMLSFTVQAQPNLDIPFQTVPDGGATAGLLALGIGAIAFARRHRK